MHRGDVIPFKRCRECGRELRARTSCEVIDKPQLTAEEVWAATCERLHWFNFWERTGKLQPIW